MEKKKFLPEYGKLDVRFFKENNGIEILLFKYSYGLNSVFFRDVSESTDWYETSSSSGSSGDGRETFGGIHYYSQAKYKAGFDVFVHGKKAMISFGSSFNFTFLEEQNSKVLFEDENNEYIPLPDRRCISSIWKASAGEGYILLTSKDFSGGGTKFHIGHQGGMREIKIKEHVVAKDGGTTYITTEEGKFYYPSPFIKDPKNVPTWKGNEIKKLEAPYIFDKHSITLILEEIGVQLKTFRETLKEE